MTDVSMSEVAEMAEATMTEAAEKIASYFSNSVSVVKNDGLYEKLNQEGEVCGIGINLSLVHDPPLYDNTPQPGITYKYIVVIDSVEYNTPADRAGMLAGDVILKVNDTNIVDGQAFYLPDDVANLIRGREGSTVSLIVGREGGMINFSMKREPVQKSIGTPSLGDSMLRKIMPVTPEGKRNLDSFEDRLK